MRLPCQAPRPPDLEASRCQAPATRLTCGSWCQHFVIRRRSGSGQSGSSHGRSPLMATCSRVGMGCEVGERRGWAGGQAVRHPVADGLHRSARPDRSPTPAAHPPTLHPSTHPPTLHHTTPTPPYLEYDLEEVCGLAPGLAPGVALVQDHSQRVHVHLVWGAGRRVGGRVEGRVARTSACLPACWTDPRPWPAARCYRQPCSAMFSPPCTPFRPRGCR